MQQINFTGTLVFFIEKTTEIVLGFSQRTGKVL